MLLRAPPRCDAATRAPYAVEVVRGSWFVILMLGWGCASPSPGVLIVDVKTDLVPGVDFDLATLSVDRGDRSRPASFEVGALEPETAWFEGVRVAEVTGLPPGRNTTLDVVLSLAGVPIVRRTVLVRVSGTTAITILITRDCVGVGCPEGTSCFGGVCAVPQCVEGGEAGCDVVECASAEDCPAAPGGCAVAACVRRVCLFVDPVCPAGQYCDIELGCDWIGEPPPPACVEGLCHICVDGVETAPVDDAACGEIDCSSLNAPFTRGGDVWERRYAPITAERCAGLDTCVTATAATCTDVSEVRTHDCDDLCESATTGGCTPRADGTVCGSEVLEGRTQDRICLAGSCERPCWLDDGSITCGEMCARTGKTCRGYVHRDTGAVSRDCGTRVRALCYGS